MTRTLGGRPGSKIAGGGREEQTESRRKGGGGRNGGVGSIDTARISHYSKGRVTEKRWDETTGGQKKKKGPSGRKEKAKLRRN